MIKVLHIVGDSKYGGGSVIIQRLAALARDMGCHADVLTTDPVFQSVLRKSGIGVVPLDVIWREIRPIRDIAGMLRLRRFLKNAGYTVVHTHTSKAGWVGRLAARLAGTPVIIHTVHGFAFHEQSHPAAIRAYSFLERAAARWCDRLVTVSEFHKRWGLSLGIGDPEKVVAIPNGISPQRIGAETDRSQVRYSLGASPEDFVILSTGRLAALKGLEHLIEAAPKLVNEFGNQIHIWLAGDGPIRADLERLAARTGVADRVRFLGFRDDVGDLLAACDVVALPSLREGLSIALLEAMAAERPIVTTTIASNREVTHDGEAAVLVPPGDIGGLVAGIRKLAMDSRFAASLAQAARLIFNASYTEARMLDQYRELYTNLLVGNSLYPETAQTVSSAY